VAWIVAGNIAIEKTIAGIVDGEFRPRSNIARSLC
jgi:hypothetical protein